MISVWSLRFADLAKIQAEHQKRKEIPILNEAGGVGLDVVLLTSTMGSPCLTRTLIIRHSLCLQGATTSGTLLGLR